MKKLSIAGVILLPMVVWLLLKFVIVSPEERIERIIHRLADAVETEDTHEALRHVSRAYRDETGLDYSQIEELAEEIFGKFDELRVFLSDLRVEAAQDTAIVDLRVAVLGEFEGDPVFLLGSFNQPVQARVLFRMEEEWKIVEAWVHVAQNGGSENS